MKKILSILIATFLLTFLCACSQQATQEPQPSDTVNARTENVQAEQTALSDQPVPANINAPERYQATWTSRTGGTQIVIDAPIEVPDTTLYPVVTVRVREIDEAQVRALADVVYGTDGYSGELSFSEPTGEEYFKISNLFLEQKNPETGLTESYLQSFHQYYYDSLVNSTIRFSTMGNSRDNWYSPNTMFSGALSGESIPGSKYDYSAALALAQTVQQAIAPELTHATAGTIHGEKPSASDDAGRAETDAYRFEFTRQIDGVPVTYESRSGDMSDSQNSYNNSRAYERLTVIVSDHGIYAVEYSNPYEIICTDDASAELISFDQLIEIAQSISPLQYASYEADGRTAEIHIDRIVLGYMRVQKRDNPEEYHLIPVWDFFGYAFSSTEDGTLIGQQTYYVSQLTISAIDGTVIDRNYGY